MIFEHHSREVAAQVAVIDDEDLLRHSGFRPPGVHGCCGLIVRDLSRSVPYEHKRIYQEE